MSIDTSPVPRLAGVHHLKLPVSDLERSQRWYASRLGYSVVQEFAEEGIVRGVVMEHPDGGPSFALRLDPARASAAAGFDYFSIGVPDKDTIEQLAQNLTAQGEQHAGVHFASVGWILPMLHDPDGHEIRFYTVERHTESDPGQVRTVNDVVETEDQRIQEAEARLSDAQSPPTLKESRA